MSCRVIWFMFLLYVEFTSEICLNLTLNQSSPMSLHKDCADFSALYIQKTGKQPTGVDLKFLGKMVNDEMEEMRVARSDAEYIDAILDAVYYILEHLGKNQVPVGELWKKTCKKKSSDDLNFGVHWFKDVCNTKEYPKKIEEIPNLVRDRADDMNTPEDAIQLVYTLLGALRFYYAHLDILPIWTLIHRANMTKFEKGYAREDGKWMKPLDFIPPDAAIEAEIQHQLKQFAHE
jgi:hypothetical protein